MFIYPLPKIKNIPFTNTDTRGLIKKYHERGCCQTPSSGRVANAKLDTCTLSNSMREISTCSMQPINLTEIATR